MLRTGLRRLATAADIGFTSGKLNKVVNQHVGTLLIASDKITRSEVVFKIDLTSVGRLFAESSMHSVQVGEQEHVDLLKVPDEKGGQARYLSHLNEPNLLATISDCLTFSALREILPGEELGFHYCTTEWTMTSPFVCARDGGRVQGYAHLDQAARLKLQRGGLLCAHVQRLAEKM
mmetsp:Transcript_27677/g.58091  ORF Transcript_27677/g.58091 Transcript_27677/m.58091 type:complete len:176 (+) Transcript_27677:69-596(+)|eukprot:s5101_g6.t1